MGNKTLQLIAMGSAIVDTEYQVSSDQLRKLNLSKGLMKLVSAAEMQEIKHSLKHTQIKQSSGGSAANTTYCASKLGIKSGFCLSIR